MGEVGRARFEEEVVVEDGDGTRKVAIGGIDDSH